MKNNLVFGAIVVIISVVLSFVLVKPVQQTIQTLGGASGPDHYNQENFYGGLKNGTLIATSSAGTSITLTARELRGWVNASLVSVTPGLLGETLTLPASSTIADIVPYPGDRQSFCIINATSTALTPIIFAGGTGTNFVVASSSATALGSTKLQTGKVGCFTFIREAKTASSYDIDALYTTYQ